MSSCMNCSSTVAGTSYVADGYVLDGGMKRDGAAVAGSDAQENKRRSAQHTARCTNQGVWRTCVVEGRGAGVGDGLWSAFDEEEAA